MFNKEKAAQADKAFTNSATLISAGTVLKGNVKSGNDLRIDGTIHGNVSSEAKVVVGPSGFVEGDIEGVQTDIAGRLVGNATAGETVQLRTTANVQGNITTPNLQIDAGAVFNGQSQMGTIDHAVLTKEGEVLHALTN